MSYIRDAQGQNKQKHENIMLAKDEENTPGPSFFIFPKNETRSTFLKAPMAHKTFSQEQFLTKFYTLKISFNNNSKDTPSLSNTSNSVFLALKLRKDILPFETNLIFLKKFQMSLVCSDIKYMKLL